MNCTRLHNMHTMRPVDLRRECKSIVDLYNGTPVSVTCPTARYSLLRLDTKNTPSQPWPWQFYLRTTPTKLIILSWFTRAASFRCPVHTIYNRLPSPQCVSVCLCSCVCACVRVSAGVRVFDYRYETAPQTPIASTHHPRQQRDAINHRSVRSVPIG